jgi:hypothetical protein
VAREAPVSIDVILAVISAGHVPEALVPDVVLHLEAARSVRQRRLEPLQRANSERSAAVRSSIHRAADEALSELVRRVYSRRQWAGLLWRWLRHPRCERFGLDGRPCLRSIRAVLRNWEPPNGEAVSPQSNQASKGETKG